MPAPQNGQTHSNNSLAKADKVFECVWPFCGVGAQRFNISWFFLYVRISFSRVDNVDGIFCKELESYRFLISSTLMFLTRWYINHSGSMSLIYNFDSYMLIYWFCGVKKLAFFVFCMWFWLSNYIWTGWFCCSSGEVFHTK